METIQAARQMPQYKSHKTVWALKIKSIEDPNGVTDGSRLLSWEDEGYAPFAVDGDYMKRHNPQIGGYYVVYKDGYKSYSPAQAFEEGNTPLLGATGEFPEGKLNASDEGELRCAILHKDGQVGIQFGKPVAWFAMGPKLARQLADLLIHHADQC